MRSPKIAFVTPGTFPLPSPNSSSVERVVEKLVPLVGTSVQARIYGRSSRNLPRLGSFNGVMCERFPAVNRGHYAQQVGQSI
ncbi:glycosyltransferase family 1 protein, partial [Paenibacillus sepulcri]|nr:glycosyltransferase family 1 protein [Paenibacillus sepulcri]